MLLLQCTWGKADMTASFVQNTNWLFFSSFTLWFMVANLYKWMEAFSLKTKTHLRIYLNWLMIKHDSDACRSYRLPYVMTNITSMPRSMKDDRLGYLNLHRISKLHCSFPPLKMFSLNLPSWWMLHAVSTHSPLPCWPDWLTVQLCRFNKRALACKRSPGVLKCHLSDFIDVEFALTHAIVKHL